MSFFKYSFISLLTILFSICQIAKADVGIKNATPYLFRFVSIDGGSCGEKCWDLTPTTPKQSGGEQWLALKTNPILISYKVCKENDWDCKNPLGSFTVSIISSKSIRIEKVEGGSAVVNNIGPTKDTYDPTKNIYASKIKFLPKSEIEKNLTLRGINLAGAEFSYPPPFPTLSHAKIFLNKGANFIRLPVLWEYLYSGNPQGPYPTPLPPIKFSEGLAKKYADLVREYTNQKLYPQTYVLIDMHNYMRFGFGMSAGNLHVVGAKNSPVTIKDYADAWGAIGKEFKDNPWVILDLANEPFAEDDRDLKLKVPAAELPLHTEQLLAIYNAAIEKIRANGFNGLISLEGMYWSGLAHWHERDRGQGKYPQGVTPSADVLIPGKIVNGVCQPLTGICDPKNNYAINVHEYFDEHGGGGGGEWDNCLPREEILDIEHFDNFMNWVKQNKVKVILSEFGGKNTKECEGTIDEFLTAVEANANTQDAQGKDTGGFIGWTAWAAGSFDDSYVLVIKDGGHQMGALERHLK